MTVKIILAQQKQEFIKDFSAILNYIYEFLNAPEPRKAHKNKAVSDSQDKKVVSIFLLLNNLL